MGPDAGEDVMQQHHVLLLQSSAITELTTLYTQVHRVDRVPGLLVRMPGRMLCSSTMFFSFSVNPPPLWERDPLACGRGGGRVPIRTRGQTPGYSRYISVLCAQVPRTMGNTGEPIPLPINHFESLSGPNLVSVRTLMSCRILLILSKTNVIF
jgi:hypothetical protein